VRVWRQRALRKIFHQLMMRAPLLRCSRPPGPLDRVVGREREEKAVVGSRKGSCRGHTPPHFLCFSSGVPLRAARRPSWPWPTRVHKPRIIMAPLLHPFCAEVLRVVPLLAISSRFQFCEYGGDTSNSKDTARHKRNHL